MLAAPFAHARDLDPIDALGDAPLRAVTQRSQAAAATPALPAGVQHLSLEERLGVPTFVQLQASGLQQTQTQARVAAADPTGVARAQLKALADLYGLTPQEVDAAPLHHVQSLPNGASLVRLTNQRDGIEVFREQATVLLDARSQATAIGGYLGSTTLAPTAQAARAAAWDMADAVGRVLQDWGFDPTVSQQLQQAAHPTDAGPGPYQWWALRAGIVGAQGATLVQPARAKPVWFRLPQGLVSAYYVEVLLHEDGEEHGWAYVVAADDGRLLLRHDQTAHAAFKYRVWANPTTLMPYPGPQGRNGIPHPTGTRDGYAAPLTAASLVTLSNVPFSQNDPWLPPGATQTLGNNVHAFANLVAPDGFNAGDEAECGADLGRDFRACATAPDTFDYAYIPGQGELSSQAQAASSVVNLFYTTNWLHDWFYDAGFDEAAGNAQADNFGRNGLGGDAINAQALDYSGANNANMLTPADGAPPRMRMYRYVNTGGGRATVSTPASLADTYEAGAANFGPLNSDVATQAVLALDASTAPSLACGAIVTDLAGKIALVDRGTCSFAIKVKNAQDAGAVGVVFIDNTEVVSGMAGVDATITIPSIKIKKSVGDQWKAALASNTLTVRIQTTGGERSSALDNGIIAHEWGHFISNRLIGDGSGLITNHARGLGEGWGDFHALLMTAAEQDQNAPGNGQFQGAYTAGNHAMAGVAGPYYDAQNIALYGIRRYPYSTDMAKNPLTLKHIINGESLPSTPLRNTNVGGTNAEVHNMGEVWTTMLWECYASLLNTHDFALAQDRMKRYLVAGYKLTPINPTLVEARDALLAAMQVQDRQLCAAGFVKRGAGAFARVPDRYSTTNAGVIENTSSSGALVVDDMQLSMTAPQALRCDADDILDSGETGVLSITVRNTGFSPVAPGGQLQLVADLMGVEFPDGTTLTLPGIAAEATATVTARIHLAGMTLPGGTRITASLVVAGQPVGFAEAMALDLPLHRDTQPARLTSDDAEAVPSVMEFGSSLTAYQNAWSVKADTPLNRFYAGVAPLTAGSHWMRTPPLKVAPTGDFKVSFNHRHKFIVGEYPSYNLIGGQLLISSDDGVTWALINQQALYNGILYNQSGNPAGGQSAYVGQSAGWPTMNTTSVNLGTAYAGQTVRLAWVVQTDFNGGLQRWEVDNIVFTGLSNTPFPAVVTDAHICAGTSNLSAVEGTPQFAAAGAAFAHPLRVRLLGAGDAPLEGAVVTFAAPGAGASATLSATTAVTNSLGEAAVTATANGTLGSYTVTATGGGSSASFALENATPVIGTCGSAQGAVLQPVAPSANLCSAGSPSVITGSNSAWNWSCTGAYGGTIASCQAPRGYTVTPTAGPGGSITPSTPQTVAYGAFAVFTVSPASGYSIGPVSGCGGTLAGSSFSTAAVTADCAVSATFIGLPLPEGPQAGQPLGLALPAGHGWQLAQASTQTVVSLGAPTLPPGVSLPHGIVSLRLEHGTQASQAKVVLTYPQALPQGARYYKFGKTQDDNIPHWYVFPGAQISGNTVTLTLRDGGAGDDDLEENSVIQDPGGVGVGGSVAAPVPTLGHAALALLAIGLGLLSAGVLRRRTLTH